MANNEKRDLIDKQEDVEEDKRLCSSCCIFPKSVYFILSTEFCERFTYYGFKAILILYLTNHILIPSHEATALYHFFACLCYFAPLFGGIIADSVLGKYLTILVFSGIYVIGTSVVTTTAMIPPNLIGPLIGMMCIGIGTGGIKPCVSTLGADQFPPENKKMIDSFFSVFYFSINLGSLSAFFTPLIRGSVQCFNDDCYALAFGVPAALMLLALSLFVLGRHMYVRRPVSENVTWKTIKCIAHAVVNWFKFRKSDPKDRFLDYAADLYDHNFLQDVRCVGRIVVLFIPLPMFWALYEQQGSRWTLQGTQMDGYITKSWVFLPDQMTSLNTILVLIFIPLFESVVYPLLDYFDISFSYLRRMVTGLLLAGLAFLAAFMLQSHMEHLQPSVIQPGMARIGLVSLENCPVSVTFYHDNYTISNDPFNAAVSPHFDATLFSENSTLAVGIKMKACQNINLNEDLSIQLNGPIDPSKAYSLVTWVNHRQLRAALLRHPTTVHKQGKAQIRVISKAKDLLTNGQLLMETQTAGTKDASISLKQSTQTSNVFLSNATDDLLVTDYIDNVGRAFYLVDVVRANNNDQKYNVGLLDIRNSEVASLIIKYNDDIGAHGFSLVHQEELAGSVVSLMWQFPQYVLISLAEVLFTISGYAFAYMESPENMKATMNAAFLLTIAAGNLMVIFVAEVRIFVLQSNEFLLFALLCLITTVIFAFMAYRYVPRYKNEYHPLLDVGLAENQQGKVNEAVVQED